MDSARLKRLRIENFRRVIEPRPEEQVTREVEIEGKIVRRLPQSARLVSGVARRQLNLHAPEQVRRRIKLGSDKSDEVYNPGAGEISHVGPEIRGDLPEIQTVIEISRPNGIPASECVAFDRRKTRAILCPRGKTAACDDAGVGNPVLFVETDDPVVAVIKFARSVHGAHITVVPES